MEHFKRAMLRLKDEISDLARDKKKQYFILRVKRTRKKVEVFLESSAIVVNRTKSELELMAFFPQKKKADLIHK